ncbi:hypothetical protein JW899_01505 [Candidatus Uhrbacteria bacterium]|nr:hypothetical protein [Candidatus Uhrbacteria bacterium]
MFTKAKIGLISAAVVSFGLGGYALNALPAGAFGTEGFRGPHGGSKAGCDLDGLERGTDEWNAKTEECRAARQAEMEAWKDMTVEERQAKMGEMKAGRLGGQGRSGGTDRFGEGKGMGPLGGMIGPRNENVDVRVDNITDGVQITITSVDAETIADLQERAARFLDRPAE